jgi:hypothetical protein
MEGMSQSTNYVIKKIHSTVICLLTWVIVNDILVHVGTVLENMKKGTSYNNKTYFEFKLPIAVININHMIIVTFDC